MTAFLFRDGDELVLTFQFWREEQLLKHPGHVGAVFVVEIQAGEFAGILEDLVAILGRDQALPVTM
ncbi:hypothetical protein [Kibdelosporangium aridum]|uniref:hypothetical protein n=1 Tax=Kibdelosporangium aridum TaxID=2030 RepID=UPI00117B1690|nr:hypothetical protein [Kibdelosporangium aridum]